MKETEGCYKKLLYWKSSDLYLKRHAGRFSVLTDPLQYNHVFSRYVGGVETKLLAERL